MGHMVTALLLLTSAQLPSQLSSAQAPPQPLPAATMNEVDRLFSEAIGAGAMPGASVSVAFADGSHFSRHYGVRSTHSSAPVTPGTRFRIGSISKLITALAILKLVEERRLGLDTPISSLLPDYPGIARLPASVTVRRLLNHTSGLPDFNRAELEAIVQRGISTDEDLEAVLQRPLIYEPGADWAYADAPYRILSRITERVSGLSFQRYIADRLAPALGLSSLRTCGSAEQDQAQGYLSRGGELRPEPAYAIRGLLGEGGLCATAEDLARLPAALRAGKWISESSLSVMVEPTRLRSGAVVDYGLGIRGGLLGRTRALGHTGGGLDGSWASVAYYPHRGVTVAVTANGTGSGTDAATLQAAVANRVLGESPPEHNLPGRDVALALTGAYARTGQTTCLSYSDGRLVRTRVGASSAPTSLLDQGGNVFARGDYPLDRIVFQTEGTGAVAYRVYYDGFFAEIWHRTESAACTSVR